MIIIDNYTPLFECGKGTTKKVYLVNIFSTISAQKSTISAQFCAAVC